MIMYANNEPAVATKLYDAGFIDLVSVAPPGADISPRSNLNEEALGKCPGKRRDDGWVGYSFTHQRPTRADTLLWQEWGANIGLLGEAFPALDIDSDDEELTEIVLKLAESLLGPAPIRLSREPRRLLPYYTEDFFAGRALQVVKDDAQHTIEFIARRQQYVVHGRHPSGEDYRWKGKPLWKLRPIDLTRITEDDVDSFLALLKEELEKQGMRCSYSRGRRHRAAEDAPPQEELRAPDLEQLKEVVESIPNTSERFPHRRDFITFGYAVKAAGGDQAFPIFLDWCSRWEGGYNDPALVRREWETLSAPFHVGYPWLLRLVGMTDVSQYFDVEPPPEGGIPENGNPRLTAFQELNDTFAVIQVGSNVRILQERADDEITLLQEKDFKLLLKHRTVPSDTGSGKPVALATEWLKYPHRRQYDDLVFKPGVENVPPSEYNLWRGWGVEPGTVGSCDRFLRHLLEVVCDDEEELCEWLLDWIAHLFQFPQQKPATAVALTGGQGAGKSIVGMVLKKLLGRHHVVAEKSEHVVGKFNSHLEACLLLQCEEAFWGGSKQAAGALKHLVTGETIPIERKFGDRREVPSYIRLLITTNEDKAWPTSIDDRRLAPFAVSSRRVGDLDYFDELIEELESGGYGKLLDTLLKREIDRNGLRRAPWTPAMSAQAAESMSPEEAWLQEFLEAGEINGSLEPDGSAQVTMESLYTGYLDSLQQTKYAKNRRAFGIWIKPHLDPEKLGRRRTGETRTTLYRLPPLPSLRTKYSGRGRGATKDWGEPSGWMLVHKGFEVEDGAADDGDEGGKDE